PGRRPSGQSDFVGSLGSETDGYCRYSSGARPRENRRVRFIVRGICENLDSRGFLSTLRSAEGSGCRPLGRGGRKRGGTRSVGARRTIDDDIRSEGCTFGSLRERGRASAQAASSLRHSSLWVF